MADDDLDVLEQQLADALAAYEGGGGDRPGESTPVPPELRERYENALDVLGVLERNWPRPGTPGRLDGPASGPPAGPSRAGTPAPAPDGLAGWVAGLLEAGGSMPGLLALLDDCAEAAMREAVAIVLTDQQHRWRADCPLPTERYLEELPALATARDARLALVAGEFLAQRECGLNPTVADFVERFPDLGTDLQSCLPGMVPAGGAGRGRPGEGRRPGRDAGVGAGASDRSGGREAPPESIGRYRVDGVLGQGGFGTVYLAWDDQLERTVAIKVPRRHRVSRPEDLEAYLGEARILAGLDHANIVPVYDAGRSDDGLCFVVSKVIDGTSLAAAAGPLRPDHAAIARLIAAVADALQHAHGKGLVHRDVKPGNILIDGGGRPFLADFGLALREEDYGRGPGQAGTPAYMSPEQARGEGHRVDGRTDVFSLGIVLCEVLTGRHPFGPGSPALIMERIARSEARPLRQVDDSIPRELERICLRALASRVSDRYSTARDMADDLRAFAAEAANPARVTADLPGPGRGGAAAPGDSLPCLVPKGLRAFDADDADFFLDLLHGPRDRAGVPEAIRFWRSRIEASGPEEAFHVGLLYGPSGCGKSSIVKAGLLPRLAPEIVPVYVEAVGGFEEGLLHRLRGACPGLDPGLGLVESLAAIRRGGAPGDGSKVLVVLDQFEQWLHANQGRQGAALVQALRQCDGRRLQALVVVRDDFWMASSRFMRELEVPVVEGHNAAAVDLFTPAHARKVLAAFGRAYGAIPDEPGRDQLAFLDLALGELAEGGKVSPIRLALFAELVKGREWTPATVEELGGSVGIGATFLEEMFSAPTAHPEHRHHEAAVRAVLGAVLPVPGEDLKGRARSGGELREAAGYARREPGDFEALMRILDRETRLLTPIAAEDPGAGPSSRPAAEPSYQLTHDYLVPSIREWLPRKQRETRRGRAGLKLAERAAFWGARPERRQLPSLVEWAEIRALTRPRTWTGAQRAMMRAAARHHLVRTGGALAIALGIALGALFVAGRLADERKATHARDLVQRLLDADIAQVPEIIAEFPGDRRRIDPLLEATLADPSAADARRLRARLALLPVDDSQSGPLREALLAADPGTFEVLREALRPRRDGLVDPLWGDLESPGRAPDRRFRAAAALAAYDPASGRWDPCTRLVAERLIAQPALLVPRWVEALRPIRGRLVDPLADLARYRAEEPRIDRERATEILTDYAADRPHVLSDLLGDEADPRAFDRLVEPLQSNGGGVAALEAMLRGGPADRAGDSPETIAGRRANAAIALLRIGRPERLWPLLKAGPDPRQRCLLVHRLGPMGVAAATLLERLRHEPDHSVQAALLLGLGGYGDSDLPEARRGELEPAILSLYRNHPDAAVHAASAWLLRRWGRRGLVRSVDRELVGSIPEGRGWSLNGLAQTMVHMPGPAEFLMGAPEGESGRKNYEAQHRVKIPHPYELSATEVTVAQYRRFLDDNPDAVKSYMVAQFRNEPDSPIVFISWYDAARFCNWLSEREGIPKGEWCYEPNPEGKYRDGMRLVDDYQDRIGYRLPTEPEWEYACRAGTTTSKSFGETDDLVSDYARTAMNSADSASQVGTYRPNAFGIFDMHGNVFEWCQNAYQEDAGKVDDRGEVVKDSASRVTRGGTFLNHPRHCRSAIRKSDSPAFPDYTSGFRLARSHPVDRRAEPGLSAE